MGCSSSKLDDEEAVQLCRDRRNFIKQAVEQRYRFALGHIAYIESLRRVSLALLSFAEGNEQRDFIADHFTTPPFMPVKGLSPEPVGIPSKSTSHVVNYLRPSGSNPAIPVEEWPGSPETVRVESFYSSNSYGTDGFFTYETSQMKNPASFSPALPQGPQWDFFWNPFSSLDQHAYQFTTNDDDDDDEMVRLTKIREREGIPELEEDGGVEEEEEEEDDKDDDAKHENNKEDEKFGNAEKKDEMKPNPVARPSTVSVEDDGEKEKVVELKECQTTRGAEGMQVSELARDDAAEVEETPGFTVYVNRRPTSMVEVVKDVESQFAGIFDSAREVSVMLEASRAALYSTPNEITGSRMWRNPVALFRSPSSSSSSRFLQAPVGSRDEAHEEGDEARSSNYHQSTAVLERLYAWEKRLYDEVKCGERIRIAYERKCAQLRKHDVNGEEPSVVDKTRAAIRDLHTQLTVSIHSVRSVSRRIEALRDHELYPHLVDLIQGLARMWRTMADCHRIQKRTIDEAKLLFFSSSPAAIANMSTITPSPLKPSKHASTLVFELRNCRSCHAAWIAAQRSYARALAGWISSCAQPQINADDADQTTIQSPHQISARAPPVFELCVRWSRLLDSVTEGQVAEGIDFFAAGIGSVSTGTAVGPEGAIVVAEIGERVLCAGTSAAVGALTQFAASSAEGYEDLVKKLE